VNEIFSSFEEKMGLHLEISEIRLAQKANGRVQHLSSGNFPLAGFEVTPEGLVEESIGPAGRDVLTERSLIGLC
jgi:hypothetical protein